MEQIQPIHKDDILHWPGPRNRWSFRHELTPASDLLRQDNSVVVYPAGTEDHKVFLRNLENDR